MATYTSYLNLEKPTTSETFNLLKMNQNWDKIDAGVSALNSKLTTKDITNELTWATEKLGTYHAWLSGNIVFINLRTYDHAISDSNALVTIPTKYCPSQNLFLYGVSWESNSKAQQALLQSSTGSLYFVGENVNAGAYTAIDISYPI